MDFTIRPLDEKEVSAVTALMDGEGWNHSGEYLNFCRQTNPSGYLVAVDNEEKIISHCGSTYITKDVGFIAFYITRKEFRGKGVGKKVFDACMSRYGDINIGLNSVKNAADMYASGGFKIQSLGIAGYIGRPVYEALDKIKEDKDIDIKPIQDSKLNEVLEFDANINPLPRKELMKKWFARHGVETLVAHKDGIVKGYAVLMKASEGYRVMPLYAAETKVAEMLWKAAIEQTEKNSDVEVAAMIDNSDANKLFSGTLSLKRDVFYNYRMYTKEAMDSKFEYVYSLCGYDVTLI